MGIVNLIIRHPGESRGPGPAVYRRIYKGSSRDWAPHQVRGGAGGGGGFANGD